MTTTATMIYLEGFVDDRTVGFLRPAENKVETVEQPGENVDGIALKEREM